MSKELGVVKKLNEYRISNKEFQMMKLRSFDPVLQRSTVVIRYSAVRY